MLLFTGTAAAQTKTINIESATFSYDNNAKKFVLSGIVCSTSDEPVTPETPDPFLVVFIQTGDGNYIQENVTYEALLDRTESFPRNGRYQYLQAGTYNASVNIIKTYDKGGPRVRQMTSSVRPIANAHANNALTYPAAAFTLSIFPGEVVPGDAMVGVITINNNYLRQSSARLYMDADLLLTARDFYFRGFNVERTVTAYPNHNTFRFDISNIPEGGVTNIFFNLHPDEHIGYYPVGESLVMRLFTHDSTQYTYNLSVARSHDPNRLVLPLNCSYYSQNGALLFEVDMENAGLADEDDITLGIKLSAENFDLRSFRVVDAVFGNQNRASVVKLRDGFPPQRTIGNSEIQVSFRNELLEGVNMLPTGHWRTRGKVRFSIKLTNVGLTKAKMPVQAIIKFGRANELTSTNTIHFRLSDFVAACKNIKNTCQSRKHCPSCKLPNPQAFWYCGFQ